MNDLLVFRLIGEKQWLGCFLMKTKPTCLRLSNGFRARAKAASNANWKAIDIPPQWYNLISDLPVKPPPQLHPKTFEPVKPEDLAALFPDELIKQEATNEKFIDIPEEVLDIYSLWRPTPLIRFVLILCKICFSFWVFCSLISHTSILYSFN